MTRRRYLVILALIAAFGAGMLAGRATRKSPAAISMERRIMLAAAQARATGPGAVLVLGDSTVELQAIPQLCGRPAINAGLSGATLRDVAMMGKRIIPAVRPARVVIAVGINDISHDPRFALATWQTAFNALAATLPRQPVIVGITAAPGLDAAMVAKMNATLAQAARRQDGRFVMGLSASETVDGVHPSLGGALAWQRRVNEACARP